ncbi:MAG: AAA family ATPase [Kiritimatiellae bacterium]|nr:AAA family ATPase [Kiritimatiellia bacterium]
MFVGREEELRRLNELLEKGTASLVVVKGRRRIGKSALIQQFASKFDLFCEFQGIAPREAVADADQRRNFGEQLGALFDVPAIRPESWHDAFSHLAALTRTGSVLILLDEISWMASGNADFAGKLKIAWDTRFKKNDRLVLVLCGSVSSWIDRNILKDADFVGRISLEIDLQELPLRHCNDFWGKAKSRIAPMEKLRLLSVTGGIPRYLEEIHVQQSAEDNIRRLCFEPGAFLCGEFDKIFNSIFSRRADAYREIVRLLAERRHSARELAAALRRPLNGDLSEHLADLETSGFVVGEHSHNVSGRQMRIRRYRLKDNYLRFYLKYIAPVKAKVEQGLFRFGGLDSLGGFPAMMGLQFENLVLNNLPAVVRKLGIELSSIVSAGPHFQNATRANKGGCQIDLMIQARFNTLYLCEIRFRGRLDAGVIGEMQRKMAVLKKPRVCSIRPVLIYEGDLADSVRISGFFDKILPFGDLLE